MGGDLNYQPEPGGQQAGGRPAREGEEAMPSRELRCRRIARSKRPEGEALEEKRWGVLHAAVADLVEVDDSVEAKSADDYDGDEARQWGEAGQRGQGKG